jgi:aspartate/methionine/tyrosine aminotransferase
MKMTYGAIEGSERLRDAIAALYERQQRDNVIVTHGTIGANSLVHQALVSRGDHVVSVIPTYQQHYSIPASIGAEVSHLRLREEHGFLPDLDELAKLSTPGTRLIAINNPNNPTGALMDRAMLEAIAAIARARGAWVLCDEVYRGTDQHGTGTTASIADIYEKGISTAGMPRTGRISPRARTSRTWFHHTIRHRRHHDETRRDRSAHPSGNGRRRDDAGHHAGSLRVRSRGGARAC